MATSSQSRKRQYQPSNQTRLTSFFGDANTSVQRPAMSPDLPPDVAASLLSVGMRVRKSVPEGYKNKAPDALGFPFPSSAPISYGTPTRQAITSMQTRELVPFCGSNKAEVICGLHNTGGYGAQQIPTSSAPPAMQASREYDGEDDMPELSMSQSTVLSSQRSFMSSQASSTSRKRTYEEESEAFMDEVFDELDEEIVAAEPPASSRPMARMKASTQKMSHGNTVRVFGSDDFEEATFLVPLDRDMDMDR